MPTNEKKTDKISNKKKSTKLIKLCFNLTKFKSLL